MDMEKLIPAFIQAGSLGILGLAVYVSLTKLLPQFFSTITTIMDVFKTEMAAQRQGFKDSLEKIERQNTEQVDQLCEKIDTLAEVIKELSQSK